MDIRIVDLVNRFDTGEIRLPLNAARLRLATSQGRKVVGLSLQALAYRMLLRVAYKARPACQKPSRRPTNRPSFNG